ncbi:CoA transferase [Tsukamurella pseudospumae]|uniref:Carnitine dehydratase n=1 Tax=Tsukamurella pseudospumae TaxID=239498 RepID=A0A138AW72_9ACTN|nr:CoA transferase [Tsukamurella pseudospumae]KXO94047.1 carnitine dehydratase [Tsukamurella pseudospumae]KXP14717.1 carnitine dehydratase [Tsukamurella pseudospumae]
MTDPLAERIRATVANPATDDGYDLNAALDEVLAALGMTAADIGGEIRFRGADPVVPSTLRLAGATSIALAAKSAAVAKLWRLRGGEGQDIDIDIRPTPHRLCPFYDRRWELLNGYPAASSADATNAFGFRFYRTRDDRWVMPLNPYPKIKVAAQRLLGAPDDEAAVAAAIARRDGLELEAAAAEAGVVLPMLRSAGEFLEHPQYVDGVAGTPLVEITRIGESAPEPLPAGEQPLSGIRALGMGHVIAGAGAGRALALHGADVLNVWRPGEHEHDTTYVTANVGVRSCLLSPHRADGAETLRELAAGADVFYANRRPGYLASIGMSAEQLVERRPGIVHATASLFGGEGPWADRVGFDQTAGSLVGMMNLEGGDGDPALPPILVVNDYIVSWLMAAGITEALTRRAVDGGSYRVHVSLVRVALWILSLGVFDRDYAHRIAGTAGEHEYPQPETFTSDTPLGRYQGVTDQVRMSGTPGEYRTVLVPRGSSDAVWLPR